MKRIELTQGQVALVDDEDYEVVSRFKWYLDGCGYARTGAHLGMLGGKRKMTHMKLHRLIMRPPEGLEVDHINHDKIDCRRSNMRVCTRSQNSQNQVKTRGASKFKGVNWNNRKNKWIARIKLNGKSIFLGYFDIETKAAAVYDVAAKQYFKEFANTNF